MTPYGPVFIIAVAVGFAATVLVRTLARRAGVVDRPDGFRKTQKDAIPLLGGIGIFVAFCAALGLSWLITGAPELAACFRSADTRLLLVGATIVLLLGFVDDVWGLRARWKFLGMFLVSLAMYAGGYRIGAISSPFGGEIELGLLALPVTVFWFLGCMNAINLIDGLDGLAAGVTLFASATVLAVGMMFGNTGASLLAAALGGACLGFLLLNFYPASIYLGDCGSLLLGFLLASIGMKGAQKSHMVVALLIPVIVMGLPIVDTSLAIVRRWLKALPFVYSDRQHIHHKLLELGLSHRAAVLVMYGACVVLAALALLMTATHSWQTAAALLVLGLLMLVVMRTIGRHEYRLLKQRAAAYVVRRGHRLACRSAGYVASGSMRNAESVDDIWRTFIKAAEKMDLDRADLTLPPAPGDNGAKGSSFRWRNGLNGHEQNDVTWTAEFPLEVDGTRLGKLRVQKLTNGQPLSGEVPETLQLLSKAVAINIARMSGAGRPEAGRRTTDAGSRRSEDGRRKADVRGR